MDRALDEVIGEQQKAKPGPQNPRRNDWNRGGPRKNGRDDRADLDDDWLHDKYDDEDDYGSQPMPRYNRDRRNRDRPSPEPDLFDKSVKIRVENLHYDLTEDDLRDLFNRVAPIIDLKLSYDRAGRSLGIAYVTYRSAGPAREAIREFDGANANGQPIRLTLMPAGPSAANRGAGGGAAPPRNPFDTAVKPGRSLFDRIERRDEGGSRSRDRRDRSRSPGGRRTNTRKPPPEGVDRYVPNDNDDRRRRRSRSRSPPRRRNGRATGERGSRRPGAGAGGEGGGRGSRPRNDESGRPLVGGRPRYTAEELDKDMEDYWGAKNSANINGDTAATAATTNETVATAPPTGISAVQDDGDIDMAE